jgi:hypothetical protein
MAMAVRENDAHGVALRAAAVIDCVGACVGGAAHDKDKDTMDIAHDVSKSVSAYGCNCTKGCILTRRRRLKSSKPSAQ